MIVLVGEPGAGKTRVAKKIEDYKTRGEWWDNIPPDCEFIVTENFYGCLKYDKLLNILDRYPSQVPIKRVFKN